MAESTRLVDLVQQGLDSFLDEQGSALGAIAPGFSLDLLADHRPNPLVGQLEDRHPGEFDIAFVEDGPELWRLRFTRR